MPHFKKYEKKNTHNEMKKLSHKRMKSQEKTRLKTTAKIKNHYGKQP